MRAAFRVTIGSVAAFLVFLLAYRTWPDSFHRAADLFQISQTIQRPLARAGYRPYLTRDVSGLETFCVAEDGYLIAALPHEPQLASEFVPKRTRRGGLIQILDKYGQLEKSWSIPQTPQQIVALSGEEILVAGDGAIGRYSRNGELRAQLTLPSIEQYLNSPLQLTREANERVDEQVRLATGTRDVLERYAREREAKLEQLLRKITDEMSNLSEPLKQKALEALKEEVSETANERRRNQKLSELFFKKQLEEHADRLIEIQRAELAESAKSIYGLAVSDGYFFVLVKSPDVEIYRLTRDFSGVRKIVAGNGAFDERSPFFCTESAVIVLSRDHLLRYSHDGEIIEPPLPMSRLNSTQQHGAIGPAAEFRLSEPVALADDSFAMASRQCVIEHWNKDGRLIANLASPEINRRTGNRVRVAFSPDGDILYVSDAFSGKLHVFAAEPAKSNSH